MEERQARKLAVILHADVVGSTELVRRNETIAHARIQDVFQRFAQTITAYGGTAHELRGDALVAEFDRASDAVSAALLFQQANEQSNAGLDDDIRPQLRIGISMGEVVIADETITGEGVVLAQRLEQLAEADSVCIQGAAYETIPQRLPFEYRNLGEQTVKGFEEPVRAYQVTLRAGETVPAMEQSVSSVKSGAAISYRAWQIPAVIALLMVIGGVIVWLQPWRVADHPDVVETEASQAPSIAVLPFTNMSQDPEQAYFSDGITEDIITDLSKVSGLLVIARNSVFAFKGRSVNVQEVARELKVGYVLEGSVRRSGERIRINAQLIDGATGHHLWADRYDRELTDVFTLQDEITREIVAALAITFTRADERRLVRVADTSPEAYDTLLRGLEHLRRFTPEANAAARNFFEQAIELDPNYARAHANISLTHTLEVSLGWAKSPQAVFGLAEDSASRALKLDPSLPQVQFSLGTLRMFQRRHEEAIAAAEQAVELDPNYADGHILLATARNYAGYPGEGLQAAQRAMRLNPLHPFFYLQILGRSYFQLEQYDQALAQFERVVERNPHFPDGRLYLCSTLGHLGRLDDASWELEELIGLVPDLSRAKAAEWQPFRTAADLERVLEGLKKAGFEE